MDAKLKKKKLPGKVSHIAGDIGRGFIAGLAGTAVMTLLQMFEMKINKREASETPVKVAGDVLDFEPKGEEEKEKLVNLIHFSYGTVWGEFRTLVSLFGLKGYKATLTHFVAVWSTALVMLPSLKASPPLKEWGIKSIVKDGFFHLIYVAATGLVYDKLHQASS